MVRRKKKLQVKNLNYKRPSLFFFQKFLPVTVITKDILTPASARDYVIKSVLILYPQRP